MSVFVPALVSALVSVPVPVQTIKQSQKLLLDKFNY